MTTNEEKLEACAQAAHEVNRAYCQALGDDTQDAWENAPEWQKSSARVGVLGVIAGNGPGDSHASWLFEKKSTGWKYGPIKDPEKKEHPCMVPFHELSRSQQQKDHLFVRTVSAMVRALEISDFSRSAKKN